MSITATSDAFGPPSLQELTKRFLASRSDADGSAVESGAGGEVEPHEVAAGFRTDPRTAWADALAALPRTDAAALPGAIPADWAGMVNQPVAVHALPFALGSFPQRVKDLHPLLTAAKLSDLAPKAGSLPISGLSGIRSHVTQLASKHQSETMLRAAGLARSIGDLAMAEEVLTNAEPLKGTEFRSAWENERAALLWSQGRCEAALAAWEAMPETAASVFNRGMAMLFLDRARDAKASLAKAVAMIPESSGWHALARLYLSLAEIRA